jgi:hypothetical protein
VTQLAILEHEHGIALPEPKRILPWFAVVGGQHRVAPQYYQSGPAHPQVSGDDGSRVSGVQVAGDGP